MAPGEPTKRFSAESPTKLGASLVRNGDSPGRRPRLASSQHCATEIRLFPRRAQRKYLGQFRSRIVVSGPASRTSLSQQISPAWYFAWPARLASRPIACKLGVNTLPGDRRPASAHRDAPWATFLADGTWRRLQSMSPCNCHARNWRLARFEARPLSVDWTSDMLSLKTDNTFPLDDLCEQAQPRRSSAARASKR